MHARHGRRVVLPQMARMFGAPVDEGAAEQVLGKLDQLKARAGPCRFAVGI